MTVSSVELMPMVARRAVSVVCRCAGLVVLWCVVIVALLVGGRLWLGMGRTDCYYEVVPPPRR